MLAPFNIRDLPMEIQENVVVLHTTDKVSFFVPSGYGLYHIKFIPQGRIKCVCYVTSFCFGRKFCHQAFALTSTDFSGNSVFPSKAKFDRHNLRCFFLHFGDSIDAVNTRRKKKGKM